MKTLLCRLKKGLLVGMLLGCPLAGRSWALSDFELGLKQMKKERMEAVELLVMDVAARSYNLKGTGGLKVRIAHTQNNELRVYHRGDIENSELYIAIEAKSFLEAFRNPKEDAVVIGEISDPIKHMIYWNMDISNRNGIRFDSYIGEDEDWFSIKEDNFRNFIKVLENFQKVSDWDEFVKNKKTISVFVSTQAPQAQIKDLMEELK